MKNPIAIKLGLSILVGVVSACAVNADNLVINGGFEHPAVTAAPHWNIFNAIPGWNLSRGSQIEVQAGVNGWQAAEVNQYVELDSDFDGPGGVLDGEPASSAIFQDLETIPNAAYELSFAFAPRPGVADNRLEVSWGGAVLDVLEADGSGFTNTLWQYHTYVVNATAGSTRLEFGDASLSDSFGTLLDDVRVDLRDERCIPEPAALGLLAIGGFALLRARR